MQEVITMMVCDHQLFTRKPAVLQDRVALFCNEFGVGQQVVKVALKHGIYQVSAQTIGARAAKLKAILGWTAYELNKSLNANPILLKRNPSTVASKYYSCKHTTFHRPKLWTYMLQPQAWQAMTGVRS